MTRNGSTLAVLASAAVGTIAGLVAFVALGVGVIESIAVGAVVMTIASFVSRLLLAAVIHDSDDGSQGGPAWHS